eukprot:COSAG01_NODE_19048_length_1034_cov_1.310160_2_plen_178_part_00
MGTEYPPISYRKCFTKKKLVAPVDEYLLRYRWVVIKNYSPQKLTRPCKRGALVASATVLPIAAAAVPRCRAHRAEGVEGFILGVLSGGYRATGASPCAATRARRARTNLGLLKQETALRTSGQEATASSAPPHRCCRHARPTPIHPRQQVPSHAPILECCNPTAAGGTGWKTWPSPS